MAAEVKTMFVLDIQSGKLERHTREQESPYPDEVLDAEWNPEVARIQPVDITADEAPVLPPTVIHESLQRLRDL